MSGDQSYAQDITDGAYPPVGGRAMEQAVGGAQPLMPRVLLVDDERHVVEGVRRTFLDYPYRISTTTSPEVALQMFRQQPFDVIVADELMPGMRGSELLTVIAREFPTSGRILLTGHATAEAAARAVNEAGVVRFLLKPCLPAKLRAAVEAALRTTPFEKRVRAHSRQVFHVSPRDRAAPTREWVLRAQKMLILEQTTLFGYELSTRLRRQAGNARTVGNSTTSTDHEARRSSADRWALRHVLEVIQEHAQLLDRRGLTVSLNIAGPSLADPVFARFLDRELSDAAVAQRFMIEVRESALVKSLRTDGELLRQLSQMNCLKWGCRLCIDGVGAEVEHFSSMGTLPIAVAKIHSRYVRDILTNPRSESLVRAVVKWGQRAGVEIAAAGIDTVTLSERLRALGVHYGQGSAFGTPEAVNLALGGLYS